LDRDPVALIYGSGKQALGAAAWSPESGLRDGASPALADLGAPGIKTTRAWV
jgi:hypothetical protein